MSQSFCNQFAQLRVAQREPPALCNAIGDVGKTLRIDAVPIAEQTVFEDSRVYLCYTICSVRCIDGQIGHINPLVFDQRKIWSFELMQQHLIDAPDDGEDLRNRLFEKPCFPLFQSLGHDGVVGIREGISSDLKSGIKIHAIVFKQPNQFRYGHRRVRIVELYGSKTRQAGIIIAMYCPKAAQNILHRG